MAQRRIGIWLIGAKGGVGTTLMVGLAALERGLTGSAGLVSQLPQFADCDLVDWNQLVVGGHDIRSGRLVDEAARMVTQSRAFDGQLLAKVSGDLEKIERNLRPGVVMNSGPTIERLADPSLRVRRETPRGAIDRIADDLRAFAADHRLQHVVVVNIASSEPAIELEGLPAKWKQLARLLDKPRKCPLPASSLYAIAAIETGCSYINFTPSLGSALPAIDELAIERGSRHAGRDGKTGETLLKSTLAPLFAKRNLSVMSWVGHNILGNLDGQVLDDPANKKSKVSSKDGLLRPILGYSPQTLVSIEYVASLGDWKTAWDHVHFQGFLGTPMTFQFIWQGCDSLLAAPLVLDLARFAERSWRAGEVGAMRFLSSFFKSPQGCDENDFARQFDMLETWAASMCQKAHSAAGTNGSARHAAPSAPKKRSRRAR